MAVSALETLQVFGLGRQMALQDRQQRTRQDASRQAAAGDYEGAANTALGGGEYQLANSLRELSAQQQAQALQEATLLESEATALEAITDPAARQAAWQTRRRDIEQFGFFSPQELDNVDLSNEGLAGYRRRGQWARQRLQPRSGEPTAFQQDLIAAGIDPRSPQGRQILQNRYTPPMVTGAYGERFQVQAEEPAPTRPPQPGDRHTFDDGIERIRQADGTWLTEAQMRAAASPAAAPQPTATPTSAGGPIEAPAFQPAPPGAVSAFDPTQGVAPVAPAQMTPDGPADIADILNQVEGDGAGGAGGGGQPTMTDEDFARESSARPRARLVPLTGPDPRLVAAEGRAERGEVRADRAAARAERADVRAAEAAARAANPIPAGYRRTAEGNLEPIPGGPAAAGGSTGISEGQQRQQEDATRRAQMEALTDQFLRVAEMYRTNFEPNDPLFGFGLSPTERAFDRAAAGLTQQGFAAFRVPGSGTQSDRDALMFAEANQLSSTSYDASNEEVLQNLQTQINARREALGMSPIDWRRPQVGDQLTRGDGLPPLTQGERSAAAGDNALDNEGGMYLTEQDRARADQIASRATAMARSGRYTPDQIDAYFREQGVNPMGGEARTTLNNFRRARRPDRFPGFSPNYVPTGRSDPNLTTGVANSEVGAAVINAGDAATFGLLDNLTDDPERTRAAMELQRRQNPVGSFIGQAAGSLVPGVGLESLASRAILGRITPAAVRTGDELRTIGEMAVRPTGNALYGAGYGAGSADQDGGDAIARLIGAARGATIGAVSGEAGDRVASGAGRTLTGVRDAGVRALVDRDIPVTLGQMTSRGGIIGRTATTVESALESVPWLGDAIRRRRRESVEGFNRATFDDALESVGGSTGGAIGEEGVDRARLVVREAYRDVLDPVRVQADDQFVSDMQAAMDLGRRLPTDMQANYRNFIENRVAEELAEGELTGVGYQALRQELREDRAAVRGQLSARRYSNALRKIEDSLEGLVRRQSPESVAGLEAADAAYRRLKVVEGAVGSGVNTDGVFTAAQLGTSARGNARKFGADEATTNRPFYESQRQAQNVLPSQVPNSGTADRTWVLAAFPALASGTAYQAGLVDADTAALFAGLGLPYTRRGQRALVKLLASRPERVRQVGEAIIRNRRWPARSGAGAGNLVTDQTPDPTEGQ